MCHSNSLCPKKMQFYLTQLLPINENQELHKDDGKISMCICNNFFFGMDTFFWQNNNNRKQHYYSNQPQELMSEHAKIQSMLQ